MLQKQHVESFPPELTVNVLTKVCMKSLVTYVNYIFFKIGLKMSVCKYTSYIPFLGGLQAFSAHLFVLFSHVQIVKFETLMLFPFAYNNKMYADSTLLFEELS